MASFLCFSLPLGFNNCLLPLALGARGEISKLELQAVHYYWITSYVTESGKKRAGEVERGKKMKALKTLELGRGIY